MVNRLEKRLQNERTYKQFLETKPKSSIIDAFVHNLSDKQLESFVKYVEKGYFSSTVKSGKF